MRHLQQHVLLWSSLCALNAVACVSSNDEGGDGDSQTTQSSSGDVASTESTSSTATTTSSTSSTGSKDNEQSSSISTSSGVSSSSSIETGKTTGNSDPGTLRDSYEPGEMCPRTAEPGEQIKDNDAEGSGRCEGKSLAELMTSIEAEYPDLSADSQNAFALDDDEYAYNYFGSHNRLVYPFTDEDGGFKLVYNLGSGDCPSGCIFHEWIYIDTDEDCAPIKLGEVQRSSGQSCMEPDEVSMWGYPQPLPYVCGEQARVVGRHTVPFEGSYVPCMRKADEQFISGELTIVIEEGDGDQPSTVRFESDDFDYPWFERKNWEAALNGYTLASQVNQIGEENKECIEEYSYDFRLDYSTCALSHLSLFEVIDEECNGDYCKGNLNIDIDLRGVQLE